MLQNYKIKDIESAQNGELYLQGNKIHVFTSDDMYICEASTLLLQDGQGFTKLIDQIYTQIRQIFEIISVLVNTLSPTLHKCCNPAAGFKEGVGCLSRELNTRIRECFKVWSQNLKRKIRRPDTGEFLSYLFGEGQKISEVSDQVNLALTEYIF